MDYYNLILEKDQSFLRMKENQNHLGNYKFDLILYYYYDIYLEYKASAALFDFEEVELNFLVFL